MNARWPKVLALWLVLAPVARADPSAMVQQEVNYLIRYIGDSGCEFKRNGSWNDAKAAQAHMRGKYDFLVRLGRIDTAKDFIDKAATGSSLSGQPYEIRCGDGVAVPSSIWLSDELTRYRASQR
jgi:hypothetical protein